MAKNSFVVGVTIVAWNIGHVGAINKYFRVLIGIIGPFLVNIADKEYSTPPFLNLSHPISNNMSHFPP